MSVGEDEPLLTSGRVGGVLVLIVAGEVAFAGDPHKAGRDGGAWRPASFGELCASGTLRAGDALAIGTPSEEATLPKGRDDRLQQHKTLPLSHLRQRRAQGPSQVMQASNYCLLAPPRQHRCTHPTLR